MIADLTRRTRRYTCTPLLAVLYVAVSKSHNRLLTARAAWRCR